MGDETMNDVTLLVLVLVAAACAAVAELVFWSLLIGMPLSQMLLG